MGSGEATYLLAPLVASKQWTKAAVRLCLHLPVLHGELLSSRCLPPSISPRASEQWLRVEGGRRPCLEPGSPPLEGTAKCKMPAAFMYPISTLIFLPGSVQHQGSTTTIASVVPMLYYTDPSMAPGLCHLVLCSFWAVLPICPEWLAGSTATVNDSAGGVFSALVQRMMAFKPPPLFLRCQVFLQTWMSFKICRKNFLVYCGPKVHLDICRWKPHLINIK